MYAVKPPGSGYTVALSSGESGDINVTSTLGAITYSGGATTVTIGGTVAVSSTIGTIDYSSSAVGVTLSGLVGINATLGTISYNSSNAIVTASSGQAIGTVEVSFKPDSITVTFKN